MTAHLTRLACLSGLALALALGTTLAGTPAHAKGKEYFSETYNFKTPHNGYSGFAGQHFCDYQKKPNIECFTDRNGRQKCVKKGWQLRQHCY